MCCIFFSLLVRFWFKQSVTIIQDGWAELTMQFLLIGLLSQPSIYSYVMGLNFGYNRYNRREDKRAGETGVSTSQHFLSLNFICDPGGFVTQQPWGN
jgi:hypothetical protein